MPFFADNTSGRPAAPPVDIRKSGVMLVDFLQCCRRDADVVRWAALSGWSIRESYYGPVAVKDAALALMVSLPGSLEIVIPATNQSGLYDLRAWITLPPLEEREEELADKQQFEQLVIWGAGKFTRSEKWVSAFAGQFTGPPMEDRPGDLLRWYRDFLGMGRFAPKRIEM
jgi:hypothetical protein